MDEDGAGHKLRSSSLLCLEASQARVSQSSLKTDRDVDGARGNIIDVAWR
jgi:hypothetical protein